MVHRLWFCHEKAQFRDFSKLKMNENSQKMIVFICEELKKMKNDTDMTCQLWHFKIENQLLNFCVGKIVGGKTPEVSRLVLRWYSVTEHFEDFLVIDILGCFGLKLS